MGEVATQPVDADMGLALGGGGGVAGFLEPVDRIVGKIVPDLACRGGMAREIIPLEQEGELVGVVRIGFVGVLGPFLLHQSVVVAEVKLPDVSPVAEVITIGSDGDLAGRCRRCARETFLGIPARIEVTDLLAGVGSDAEFHRSLAHDDVGGAVVEGSVHHDADAPLIETLNKGLELLHGVGGGVASAQHGGHRPVISHRVRAAGIERLARGFGVYISTFHADGVNGLEPEHVDAEGCVVVLIQGVRTALVTSSFARQSGIVNKVEESAAT